jgi:alpha-L-rhamnosidase
LYEATLNGKRIGDQVLAPGWQSYNHYLAYQIYDVTDLLVSGTNVLGAYVGEGWYATRLGRPGERNLWGDRPSFLGQLEVDGNVVVKTDSSWVWADGPVITSEIYDGETVDTRLDNETWWKAKGSPVEVLGKPKGKLVARDAPPVRRLLEVKPKEVITTKSGKKVLDFGQNLVGWVRIDKDFAAKEGSIKIRHAEVMEHGELGVRPLRTAKATDEIILGGKTKGWEPKFTFHGFRYAEVSGVDVDLDSFTAVVVYSDMRRTGTFHSSHSAINQLHSNVVWSMMGNFVSVPTDCPQRDERLGWTGDIQAFAPTANFLFDTAGFLGGWLNDVDAEQRRDHNNIPPEVVPKVTMNKRPVRPMAIWADVVALTPWDLYEAFGDEHLLSQQWESMCLWLDKGLPRRSTGLWDHRAVQYGDWLDPRAPPQLPAHGLTDTHLAADAYLVWTTGIVAKIAHVLGKEAEAKRWDKNYADVLREFRLEYVSANGRLVSDTQTAIALALRFGLIEGEKQREHSRERLEYLVRWDAFKISTGFAGTPK